MMMATVATAAAQGSMGMGDRTVAVTITNLTSHQTFAPPVLVSHGDGYLPFELGVPVLPELVPLAEDGMTQDFVTVAKVESAILDFAIADAPLPPGRSVTLQVHVDDAHPLLSAFGMLVTTNDTVFYYGADLAMSGQGMGSSDTMGSSDSMGSSDTMGSSGSMGSSAGMGGDAMAMHVDLYDGTVRALDAGSEANTERCHSIPGPPCGNVGNRHTDMAEGVVTLSKGILGTGDLDPAVYGWTDPVAKVEIASP